MTGLDFVKQSIVSKEKYYRDISIYIVCHVQFEAKMLFNNWILIEKHAC